MTDANPPLVEQIRQHILRWACPRCGAEPGKPCDRRTRGAHEFHRARIGPAAA